MDEFCGGGDAVRKKVIEGRLWRKLCIKLFPEVKSFEHVNIGFASNEQDFASSQQCWEGVLKKEHHVYSRLFDEMNAPPVKRSCILEPLSASSTDNFPAKSIVQTLYPRPRFCDDKTPSYWSSKGQINADVSETLTYQLVSHLCVVHEVKIHPFQAFLQAGSPIYSSRFVRFRLGCFNRTSCSSSSEIASGSLLTADEASSQNCIWTFATDVQSNKDYVWTYVSPEFAMGQADTLQSFRLPSPVLCIGGVLQVELLGRVQARQSDQLYYICISHVNVVGRPLMEFDCEVSNTPGKFICKYSQGANGLELFPGTTLRTLFFGEDRTLVSGEERTAWISPWRLLGERIRQLNNGGLIHQNRFVLDTFLRNIALALLLLPVDH